MTKKYFTISEVSAQLNANPSLIRFWEKEFSTVLKPLKNKNGERRYREKDIDKLNYIHRLIKEKGYSLRGAKKFMASWHKVGKHNPTDIASNLCTVKKFLIKLRNELQN